MTHSFSSTRRAASAPLTVVLLAAFVAGTVAAPQQAQPQQQQAQQPPDVPRFDLSTGVSIVSVDVVVRQRDPSSKTSASFNTAPVF